MRQVREILRLKYEQRLAHRAIARACGVGLGRVSEYCRRAEQAGVPWPLPPDGTTPSSKPACSSGSAMWSACPGLGPTWPGCIRSSSAPASPSSGCTSSTWNTTPPTATASASSAGTTMTGRAPWRPRCARSTARGRRPSWTSLGSGPRSSTARPANWSVSSSSSACWGRAATWTPRRVQPRICPRGSPPMCGWWNSSVAPPRCSSPTISRVASPSPAGTSPSSIALTWSSRSTTGPPSCPLGRAIREIKPSSRRVC